MYVASLLGLTEQSLEVLRLVFHCDVPHTNPQLPQLRDDYRHL